MPDLDLSLYQGREQEFIKHSLLRDYLPDWGYKVGSEWDSLIYVDGFAGPWGTQAADLSDSSFGVAISALHKVASTLASGRGRSLNVKTVLVELADEPLDKLKEYAQRQSKPGFTVEVLGGRFADHIPAICRIAASSGSSAFKFVFLDPKGWSDMPMQKLLPLIKGRSCEVVVNLMTRFLIRFLDQDDRAQSVLDLFGRPDVLPSVRNEPPDERQDALVREYCKSLHKLADYKYVSSAAVFAPDRDEIRYFLVYGTNHHRGIEVFKSAEAKAARIQDDIRHSNKQRGQTDMFGGLFGSDAPKSNFAFSQWQRYCSKAKHKIVKRLIQNGSRGASYLELFTDAMAFPLVTHSDLRSWMDDLSNERVIQVKLERDRRGKPSPDQDDRVFALNLERLDAWKDR